MATRYKLKPGEVFDSPTRWLVESRSKPGEVYLIELLSYRGNGSCTCMSFVTRMEPLLARGVDADFAYTQNLIPQPKDWPNKPAEHALRCPHLLEARNAYAQMKLEEDAAIQKAEFNCNR
jgi:hypothetical protein